MQSWRGAHMAHRATAARRGRAAQLRLGLLLGSLAAAVCDEYTHKYKPNEDVSLWVNKVGPYHNPQETYVYFSLPFCTTKAVDKLEHRWDALGEVLEGNDLISSGLPVRFQEPVGERSKICSMKLREEDSATLQYAVRNHCACSPIDHSARVIAEVATAAAR